jgi:outer membrane protein assembly factor BamB
MRWGALEVSASLLHRKLSAARGWILPLLCAFLLAGCSLFSKPKRVPDPLPVPSGAARVDPAWNVALGAASGVGFAPAVVGDAVWAAAQNGTIAVFDLDTGRERWRILAGKPLSAGVGTDGTTGVVVSRDGALLAFDANGRALWSVSLGGEVITAPAVADGVVLLRTSDNRVLAFDAASGKRRWTYQRQNPPLVLRNSGGIAMVPGVGFVGMPGGRLAALSLGSGAPRWDVPLATPRGANELERVTDVVGTPLVIGRELCAVTYQGRIGCLDLSSGAPVWSREFSSAVGFDVDNSGLISPDADDTVHAFDRRGTPVWQQKGYAGRRLSAPLIVGRLVILGDYQGNLLWLSRDDGTLAAVTRTDGTAVVASAAASGRVVVSQTSGGALHAFRVE